ncbi:S41 family peptidase [Clostridium sp. 'deep sea']|uniref:S41 family peptidase n=1 Tax=Clostridium sp. 'deep sea' TaxID=2779445 RepID=UPI0018967221|nr:S41 family peptidase [Clostridium sp. 'deep sea']QOR34806.1 S41 family peptidase [Clostridium sp. 'deep sea']
MKKKYISLIMVVTLLTMLTACSTTTTALKYTTEQKQEDFLFAYNVLANEYPLFAVKQRQHKVQWLANKDTYLKRITETKNDKQFYKELALIIAEIKDGHTNVVSPTFYYYVQDLLKNSEVNSDKFVNEFLVEPLNDSQEDYKYWNEVFGNPKKVTQKDIKNNTKKSVDFSSYHNGDTIYIKFSSFSVSEEGCQQVYDYIVENKNCSNIIIDIRDNSGGSDLQWINNIVSPLNNNTYQNNKYMALRGGEISEKYTKILGGNKIAICERPELPNYPPEISTDFKYLLKTEQKIVPQKPIGFTGDIYVLTNKKVFSAGEGFATFCKRTGFATLVGERTGGDGGSTSPIFVKLPNSGLLLRMRLQMTLNPDGSANAEYGTAPDIEVKAEHALTETLKIIEGKTE